MRNLLADNRKFVCALEPFAYAAITLLFLNVVGIFCDCRFPLYFAGICSGLVLCTYRWRTQHEYDVAVRSCGLGFVFASGLIMVFSNFFWQFGLYLCALSFFHWSEYAFLAAVNPSRSTVDSFMLNHSAEYYIAAICSWIEFFIEQWIFPEMKHWIGISVFGLFLIVVGESIRKMAIVHLGSNFTHLIQVIPLENHKLVTNGLYCYIRHPSYMGWFWFSIGTQLLLVNPFCVVAYAATAWLFFRDRIETEEILLTQFFGSAYLEYKQRSISGLPFIKGYAPL